MTEHNIFDGSPLLTKKQRRLLWERVHGDAQDDGSGSWDRRERSRTRARVRDIVSDFRFLFRYLPPDERKAIFEDLDEFAEYRLSEYEHIADADTERMQPVAEESDAAKRGDELYNGIVGALAFLYAGVGNTRAFENMLARAIEEAAKQDDTLLRADVSIELSNERDREELLDKWDAGEITKEELLEALDDDPTLLFEKRDSDDEE